MPIAYIFWMLMIIWAVFGVWYRGYGTGVAFGWVGDWLLLFVLIALLGWHVFGSVVK